MANTKISALTALTNPTGSEEFVYAYNNANGKVTLNTMKSFVGWAGITTLNADANIWELSEWFYETTYDLYYKSGSKVPAMSTTWATKKQMLFVTEESTGEKGFLVYNVWHKNTTYVSRASFGYSVSSSEWKMYELRDWDASLKQYADGMASSVYSPNALDNYNLSQIIDDIDDSTTNELSIGSNPYVWATYTIYINSVKTAETYSIVLGTWVTNPLWIALPTSSNKKCVITVLITSATTWVVTSCTIES